MNKLLLFILLLIVCNFSCAQANRDSVPYTIENYINEESMLTNKNNFMTEINKQVKHYPEEPIYYLRINKQNCIIEICINDVRRFKNYELSNYVTPL